MIARRERPHPGAQFTIFDEYGYRYTCFITDQAGADIALLEMRHRQRARVEDCIRNGKDTGMRNLPHHAFLHNQTWLEISLIAVFEDSDGRWVAVANENLRAALTQSGLTIEEFADPDVVAVDPKQCNAGSLGVFRTSRAVPGSPARSIPPNMTSGQDSGPPSTPMVLARRPWSPSLRPTSSAATPTPTTRARRSPER